MIVEAYLEVIFADNILEDWITQFFLEFAPTQGDLIETLPFMGKEFYVTLEVKVESFPSSGVTGVFMFSKLMPRLVCYPSGFRFRVNKDGAEVLKDVPASTTNTYYHIEVLQTLVVDKVNYMLNVNLLKIPKFSTSRR